MLKEGVIEDEAVVKLRRPLFRSIPGVPAPSLPVGGRIKHFAGQWRTITEDTLVRSVVEEGYIIPFRSTPHLSTRPLPFTVNCPVQAELVKEEIASLLVKLAIEPVMNVKSPGFYSRIFLVAKKNGSLKPVIDLSALNKFVHLEKFKMGKYLIKISFN